VGGSELLIIGWIFQSGNGSLLCLKESIRKCPLNNYSCSLEASKVKKEPGEEVGSSQKSETISGGREFGGSTGFGDFSDAQ